MKKFYLLAFLLVLILLAAAFYAYFSNPKYTPPRPSSSPTLAPTPDPKTFNSSDDENQITGQVTAIDDTSITVVADGQEFNYSLSSQVGVSWVSTLNSFSASGKISDVMVGDKAKLSLLPGQTGKSVIGILLYK